MTKNNVVKFKQVDLSKIKKGNNVHELETMSLLYCAFCAHRGFEVVMSKPANNIEETNIFALCQRCGTINDPKGLSDDSRG